MLILPRISNITVSYNKLGTTVGAGDWNYSGVMVEETVHLAAERHQYHLQSVLKAWSLFAVLPSLPSLCSDFFLIIFGLHDGPSTICSLLLNLLHHFSPYVHSFRYMYWSSLRWRIVFPMICAVDLFFFFFFFFCTMQCWVQPWGESTGTATVHWFRQRTCSIFTQKKKKKKKAKRCKRFWAGVAFEETQVAPRLHLKY